MPVGFLTDEQRYAYGRFNGEPTADQLARYFHLDDTDRKLISNRRADHNRLGFAVQLCTVRFLGVFLENLSETPPGIVAYLGHQLGIKDTCSFSTYCASKARWDHAPKIRSHCGFREFSEPQVQFRLNRWLYALCWTGTDRPSVLFDRAIAWLLTHKVLLPGATVLERCVARVRSRTQERVWGQLTRQISEATKTKLENLLVVPEDGHRSLLDRLRKGPFLRSAPELVRALRRIDEVRAFGINLSVSSRVPPTRIQVLARFATTAKASAIERLPEQRRLATITAFALNLEAIALDDALDLLDILISEIFAEATTAGEKARLRTIKDLDAAAGQLGQVCRLVLDKSIPDSALRQAIFGIVPRGDLEIALDQVERLVRPPEDMYYQELGKSYRRVRTFLPALLKTIQFGATPAGQLVLDALEFLRTTEDQKGRAGAKDPPLGLVTRAWQQYVGKNGKGIDRKAYTFCCLDRLRSALRRRDLFVAPSFRYADARIGLLSGPAWESARLTVCRSLGHSLSAEER
jgi:hypothetical protein